MRDDIVRQTALSFCLRKKQRINTIRVSCVHDISEFFEFLNVQLNKTCQRPPINKYSSKYTSYNFGDQEVKAKIIRLKLAHVYI